MCPSAPSQPPSITRAPGALRPVPPWTSPRAFAFPRRRFLPWRTRLRALRLRALPLLCLRALRALHRALRQCAPTRFAVPLFVGVRRDLPLDEQLREFAPLRLALEWHTPSGSRKGLRYDAIQMRWKFFSTSR